VTGARLFARGAAGLLLLALAIRFAVPEDARNLAALAAAFRAPAVEALAWFAVAVALFGANFAAGAARFSGLLRGAGLDPDYGPLFRAYLVASFANVVLPGGLGDVYRFFDARRDTGRGGEVLGIVVLERLLSLAALGAIVLLALPFLQLEGPGGLWAVAALCTLAPLCPLRPVGRALLRRALPLVAALSARAAAACERALDAVALVSQQPAVLLRALGLSLGMHALPVAAVVALAAPLDADVAAPWFALIVPVVTLLSLIPVSVAGIGVREYLYIALFGAVGMRPEVALTLSLLTFAVTLVWAGIGLALFAAGRRPQEAGS
jgi:uncharacterized membrane protein YbhN (UPF0104 family)